MVKTQQDFTTEATKRPFQTAIKSAHAREAAIQALHKKYGPLARKIYNALKEAGATYVVFHTGPCDPTTGASEGYDRDETLQTCDRFQKSVERAMNFVSHFQDMEHGRGIQYEATPQDFHDMFNPNSGSWRCSTHSLDQDAEALKGDKVTDIYAKARFFAVQFPVDAQDLCNSIQTWRAEKARKAESRRAGREAQMQQDLAEHQKKLGLT